MRAKSHGRSPLDLRRSAYDAIALNLLSRTKTQGTDNANQKRHNNRNDRSLIGPRILNSSAPFYPLYCSILTQRAEAAIYDTRTISTRP